MYACVAGWGKRCIGYCISPIAFMHPAHTFTCVNTRTHTPSSLSLSHTHTHTCSRVHGCIHTHRRAPSLIHIHLPSLPLTHIHHPCSQVEVVKSLLAESASVTVTDAQGNTALHYAAGYGRVDALKLLLDAGANAAEVNGNGKNALELVKYVVDPWGRVCVCVWQGWWEG